MITQSEKPYFIIEADEFRRHFHLLDTDIALITNIEHDHTDIYPSKQDYVDAFQLFIDHTKSKVITHQSAASIMAIPADKLILTSDQHFNFKYVFGGHNQANANLVYSLVKELERGNNERILNFEF